MYFVRFSQQAFCRTKPRNKFQRVALNRVRSRVSSSPLSDVCLMFCVCFLRTAFRGTLIFICDRNSVSGCADWVFCESDAFPPVFSVCARRDALAARSTGISSYGTLSCLPAGPPWGQCYRFLLGQEDTAIGSGSLFTSKSESFHVGKRVCRV